MGLGFLLEVLKMLKVDYRDISKSGNIPKTTDMLNGCVVWYMNYISINLSFKKAKH